MRGPSPKGRLCSGQPDCCLLVSSEAAVPSSPFALLPLTASCPPLPAAITPLAGGEALLLLESELCSSHRSGWKVSRLYL